MEDVIKVTLEDPLKGILIAAILALIYFIKKDNKHREDQVKAHKGIAAELSTDFGLIKRDYTESATELQESLGKATKAINGDMLRIKQDLFDLRQELIREIESVKNQYASLGRTSSEVAHRLELVVERFEEKYGRIVEIKEKSEYSYGRVVHIEASIGEQAIALKKHKDQIASIARILEAQRQRDLDKERK